jgi:hypothetical protein
MGRVGDVDDPQTVVVARDGEMTLEGQVGLEVAATRRVVPAKVAGTGNVRQGFGLGAVLVLVVGRLCWRRPHAGHHYSRHGEQR